MALVTKLLAAGRIPKIEIRFPDGRAIDLSKDDWGKILVSSRGSPHLTVAVNALVDCASARLAEPGTPFLDTDGIMEAAGNAAVHCGDAYAYLVELPRALLFDQVGTGSVGDAFG